MNEYLVMMNMIYGANEIQLRNKRIKKQIKRKKLKNRKLEENLIENAKNPIKIRKKNLLFLLEKKNF